MAGEINRQPRGLLGTLDAKTRGRTPPEFASTLMPVYDLSPNYLADIPSRVTTATSATVTAVGTNVSITVPSGEMWYVYECSLIVSALTAALIYRAGIMMRALDNGLVHLCTNSGFNTTLTNVGDSFVMNKHFDQPLLATGGIRFFGFNHFLLSNAASFSLSVLHKPVSI